MDTDMSADQDLQIHASSMTTELKAPQAAKPNLWATVAAVGFGVMALVSFVLDRDGSRRALITPINAVALTLMRGIGTFCGLVIAYVLLSGRELAFYRKAIIFMMIPFGGFMLGDGIAWRMADHREFGDSSLPYSTASYPIVGLTGGGKSHTYSLEIDPYHTGEPAKIAIPYGQYSRLAPDFRGKCVTIEERRAPDGAVEIRTVPANSAVGGEADVESCGQSAPSWNLLAT
jgi:hypothetical protein